MSAPNPIDPVYIDGMPFIARILTGEATSGERSEWDDLFDHFGAGSDLLHFDKLASWCSGDASSHDFAESQVPKLLRGYLSSQHKEYLPPNRSEDYIGYCPVLCPLEPDVLFPGFTSFSSIPDGTILSFGTLFMNDNAVKIPLKPLNSGGNCADWIEGTTKYKPGATLQLGDTARLVRKRIRFIKFGNILVSDRNILRGVSWSDLAENGLIPCKE